MLSKERLFSAAARLARVGLVSRLRLDAALQDAPVPPPPGKRGPKPKMGARQLPLATRLLDPGTLWQAVTAPWYGGHGEVVVEIATGVALWHRSGEPPLPLRWVLVRDPQQRWRPRALFSTDPAASAAQVLRLELLRWNGEVTVEELRAHLDFETRAPVVYPCYRSHHPLPRRPLQPRHALRPRAASPPTAHPLIAAWNPKAEATVADALAAVRRLLTCTTCAPSALGADAPPHHRPRSGLLWPMSGAMRPERGQRRVSYRGG